MKNMVHIKSLIPSTIIIDGEEIQSNSADIISTKNFYISFYPKEKEKYMPCSLSLNSNLLPSGVTKIPYINNHYDIIYNPTTLPNTKDEIIILNKKYKNTIFSIKNSTQSFITISNISSNHASTTNTINSLEFKIFDNIVAIIGKCHNLKTYLLIYNTQKHNVVVEELFSKVEITKSHIKALKEEKSLTGYGKIYEFNISTKVLQKYSVFLHNNLPNHTEKAEITAMCFLESIKYGDFKKALLYLENQNTSIEHIKNYFGEIKEIYLNKYSQNVNFTILTSKFRSFTFTINNNKIVDIEENQLNLT